MPALCDVQTSQSSRPFGHSVRDPKTRATGICAGDSNTSGCLQPCNNGSCSATKLLRHSHCQPQMTWPWPCGVGVGSTYAFGYGLVCGGHEYVWRPWRPSHTFRSQKTCASTFSQSSSSIQCSTWSLIRHPSNANVSAP